jgi:2-dehydropantoate 2-reductase
MAQTIGKIGLVGAGAVGGFYGLMLRQAGEDVHFLLRSNFEKVKKDGFSLIHHLPERKVEEIKNIPIYEDTPSIGVCDWVIIATKANANDQVIKLVRPLVDENTSILTLQNGMGNVENIARAFGEERVILGGLCFTCINRTTPNTIESILPGYVQFGQYGSILSNKAVSLVDIFEQSGVKVSRAESLPEVLWRKLCWNVPFNGLSIVGGGITTDQILTDQDLRKRAGQLMNEIQAGAKSQGIIIEDQFLDKQFYLTEPMGAYKPSSLIDYLAGKPVEVEAIFGEALRRGQEKGVEMPELCNLYKELIELTSIH